MNKKQAEETWKELREHFVNAEALIKKIIDSKAWEPLGYASFAEAWNDRMAGVRLATDAARAYVVYALYDSGHTPDEVAGVVAGVSLSGARQLATSKAAGTPPEFAKTWGRTINPEPETHPIIIRNIPKALFERYEALAAKHDSTLEKEAARAVHAHFEALK
ncbi:hypothetical protein [Jiangella anatolica]|uniref:Uncharacterized protein n=1 Tax=Jiangella anatolica TaxID=2670374 RepID=A0A2W2CSN4_9ACTN|nr:hypothetical protein [Jiangella anatolica]PZF83213.1 hypothetical protein C1I92_13125 [Jiangella anatolica]